MSIESFVNRGTTTVWRSVKVDNTQRPKSAGRPKSKEKRRQILNSASCLLLSQGYANTSMESVAKHSSVSKQTVYSHFANKDALFNAVIESKCAQYQIDESMLHDTHLNLETLLYEVGLKFMQLLTDENVISMYKVVIGDANQDSHVARLFYQAGPMHSVNMMCKIFQTHPQSALDEASARTLSIDFFNLLKGDFHMLSILHLPYNLDESAQQSRAKTVAKQTLALLSLCNSNVTN